MNYTIHIDHDNKLIRYTHYGDITREDIGIAWADLVKLGEFTHQKYNLLTDYSQGRFDGSAADIELINDELFSLKEIVNGKKQAMIQSEPMSTALSIIFEEEVFKRTGFIVKVFSTIDAAEEWLTS